MANSAWASSPEASPTIGACTPPSCLCTCSRALAMQLTPIPARSDMREGPDAPLSRVAHTRPLSAPPPETRRRSPPHVCKLPPGCGVTPDAPLGRVAQPAVGLRAAFCSTEQGRHVPGTHDQCEDRCTGHDSMESHRVGPQGGARGEGARPASSRPAPTLSRPAAQPRCAAAQPGVQPPGQGVSRSPPRGAPRGSSRRFRRAVRPSARQSLSRPTKSARSEGAPCPPSRAPPRS